MPPSTLSKPARAPRLLLAVCALLGGATAVANDRPFQYARTAVMEDDDEPVWSFESLLQRCGSVFGAAGELEYAFSPADSVQFELAHAQDRLGAQSGNEGEIELKHLFNDIARDGWAWGLSAAFGDERSVADGSVRSVAVKVPLSIALGADGSGYLHLDAGVGRQTGAARVWSASAAIEHEIGRHDSGFAEVVHEGSLKFVQAGVRHWVRKGKMALDFSLQQQRSEGTRASGFVIGFGWYDL